MMEGLGRRGVEALEEREGEGFRSFLKGEGLESEGT